MARFMSQARRAEVHRSVLAPREPKRALAFGGGGPAVGISLGFLLALEEWNSRARDRGRDGCVIEFPVWVAGCVGGWLTCLYHLCDEPRAQKVEEMIRGFFRETVMYENFPCPKTFTPDVPAQILEGFKFLIDPRRYPNLVVPDQIARGWRDMVDFYLTPSRWNRGDFSYMLLNSILAPNPAARLTMTLLYKTPVPGLNTLWFGEDYSLLKQFDLKKLESPALPHIYINSYNLDTHRSDIYTNHPQGRPIKADPITMPALCASSALPYILSPVQVGSQTHIEGALVDSFCFEAVHECHADINEIWVSRIVDHSQVREPKNLLDALNNLIMLYAGTTSRNDIELFAHHINHEELMDCQASRRKADPIEVLQLPVESTTTYLWSYENLDNSLRRSKANCLKFIEDYCATLDRGQRVPRMHNVFPRRGAQFHAPDGSIAPAYRVDHATAPPARAAAAKKAAPRRRAAAK